MNCSRKRHPTHSRFSIRLPPQGRGTCPGEKAPVARCSFCFCFFLNLRVCVCYLFLIEGRLLYNIGLISSIQQHELAMLCLTLCDPLDRSLPGSSVHGILQARILEWVAMPSFRGSSQPRDGAWVSCIAGRFFTI